MGTFKISDKTNITAGNCAIDDELLLDVGTDYNALTLAELGKFIGYGQNVKDYGAVGDGSADDTTAIGSALTAGAGGVVYFPSGVYKISGTLTVPDGTMVKGVGACDVFYPATTGSTINVTHTGSVGMLVGRGATIDGLNFYYPDQIHTAAAAKSLDVGPAVDRTGGVVGIPCTSHGFSTGNTVFIVGTTYYDGKHTVRSDSTTHEIRIEYTYTAETFSAADKVQIYSPTVYDYTIQIDNTDTDHYSGNNAGVNLKNIVIHNAYNGIDLGGSTTAATPVYGSVMINNVRMFALYIGVHCGATWSEVSATDFVFSWGMWADSIGTAARLWVYTDGQAIWWHESSQGFQYSNCTFFGHKRGILFSNSDLDVAAMRTVTFLKTTGCLFDGLIYPIEVADKMSISMGNFVGCIINAGQSPCHVGQSTTTLSNACIGFHLNLSEYPNYVTFSGCQFGGSAGTHVKINTSEAVYNRIQFASCMFLTANRQNDTTATYYNVLADDPLLTLQLDGCLISNAYPATITNVKVTNARILSIDGLTVFDNGSKLFEIGTVTNQLVIRGITAHDVTSTSTFPSSGLLTVASAATITLPDTDAKAFIISGTTDITSVTASWPDRVVTLIFSGILTFTDGSNLKLAGSLTTSADDTITIACNGTNWYEVARSVN